MMLGIIYTVSEALLETIRDKKDNLNAFGAGAIAGALVMSRNGTRKSIIGAIGFSCYTGMNQFFYTRSDNC